MSGKSHKLTHAHSAKREMMIMPL